MPKWLKYATGATAVLLGGTILLAFRCLHKNISQPFTRPKVNRLDKDEPLQHYVCCLDCGKELVYDWNIMKVIGEIQQQLNDLEKEVYGNRNLDTVPGDAILSRDS